MNKDIKIDWMDEEKNKKKRKKSEKLNYLNIHSTDIRIEVLKYYQEKTYIVRIKNNNNIRVMF